MSSSRSTVRYHVAKILGYAFHPFLIFIAGTFVALREEEIFETVKWILLVSLITILPTLVMMMLLQYRGYRREQLGVRGSVYVIAWLCILFCAGLLLLLDAPVRLVICMFAILGWLFLHFLINAYLTKISGHAGFSMSVAMGLFFFGELGNIVYVAIASIIVVLTAWARITTNDHTCTQVFLGWVIAVISVGFVFFLASN
ncbi:MAG: phosphatase PAP2 family protein [Bacillota bacterium]